MGEFIVFLLDWYEGGDGPNLSRENSASFALTQFYYLLTKRLSIDGFLHGFVRLPFVILLLIDQAVINRCEVTLCYFTID
jgi:hypothetical protein